MLCTYYASQRKREGRAETRWKEEVWTLYGHRDEKSGSRLLPKPEKHLGWRCWGNPGQVGLGKAAREQGGGPTGAEN